MSPAIDLPLTAPASVFLVLAVVILVGPLVAERFRLPGVIGLVVAGVIVGPEGLGLLARSGTIEQLGGFGLLYLMFLAGLELDLDVLNTGRRSAVVFGFLTFSIPIGVGFISSILLGFDVLASVLIGSLWASHTLVAYPIIRRSGIVSDASVASTVGATVITDTLALIVLAVVAGSFEGGAGFLLLLIPGLALLAGAALWALPRLARWFFTGLGQDRTVRFVFILVGFLGSAVLAEAVGIEGIVGAFLAGLALNRLVPNGGILMQRVEFVGSALFIPMFLLSVGMLVDFRVVVDSSTLALAGAFTAVAMTGKWMAAEIAGRAFRFSRAQIGVMFSLSNSQAAATLAATIVGFEIGLLDERVVNAVLLVILVTVVVSSWVATRSAPRVTPAPVPAGRLGRTVLVPVANPDAAPELIRLAVWMARADGGDVIPFHVVPAPDGERVRATRPLLTEVASLAAQLGTDVDPFVRVDRSISAGVVNTVVERDASLVMLGWKGATTTRDRLFGSLFVDIVERVPCVVAAAWVPTGDVRRIVLMPGLVDESSPADARAAVEFCRRLGRGSGLEVVVWEGSDLLAVEGAEAGWSRMTVAPQVSELVPKLGRGDLMVAPAATGRDIVGWLAQALVEAVPDLDLVVVHSGSPTVGSGIDELFAGG